MLYIIGLGLNSRGFSQEAYIATHKADKVYLENYTVELPYNVRELEKTLEISIEELGREKVESDFLVKEAKKKKVCLLVYGSPLFATTHTALIEEARKSGVKVEILYNASIYDAILETGLQAYKFGKTASLPIWSEKYRPMSFMDIVSDNKKIKAHSLILIDIGLSLGEALRQLDQASKAKKVKLDKIVLCSQLGTSKSKITYNTISKLKELKKTKAPFCFIVPGDLHFSEEGFLNK
jgi:diphthine synthase